MVGQVQSAALLAMLCAPVLGGIAASWRPWLAIAGAACAWLGSVTLLGSALFGEEATLSLGRWLEAGSFAVDMDLRVDLLAAILLLGGHSVVLAAMLYAADYLHRQADRSLRFSSILITGSTLLFCADNYLLLFAGWVLLGIGSYLLAAMDHTEVERAVADRIWAVLHGGDLILLAGLVALCAQGQVNWVEALGGHHWIGLCILLAVVARSAQFPLHFWLTGVRSPGTLVQLCCTATSGLYVLLRTRGVWGSDPVLVYVALAFGLASILFGAVSSLLARDLRLALAYAVSSQLGLVLAAMALDCGQGVVLHLVLIGVGMGLCFIGCACLAQVEGENWDLANLGRYRRLLPLPFWAMVLGALTISGIPPLAGFWSYGLLLTGLYTLGGTALWVGGAVLVVVASWCLMRLVFLISTAEIGEQLQAFRTPGGAAQAALVGLGVLVLAAAALGYPPGIGFFSAAEGARRWEWLIGGIAGLVGVLVAWLAYGGQPLSEAQQSGASAQKCYVEALWRALLGRPLLALARWARDLDTLFFEWILVEFGVLGLRSFGWILGRLQNGQVRSYAALALLGVVAALFYLSIR